MCQKTHQHGFTLIELMVVLLVIAVATSVVTMGIHQVSRQDVKQVSNEIDAWAHHVSSLAVVTGNHYHVSMDGASLLAKAWGSSSSSSKPGVRVTHFPLPNGLRLVQSNKNQEILFSVLSSGEMLKHVDLSLSDGDESVVLTFLSVDRDFGLVNEQG